LTITECPGCHHDRDVHKNASCYRLVEAVTTGGENHLTICGYCGWLPTINENGTRGWRHEAGGRVGLQDDVENTEAETLEAALLEVNRIMGLR
jgi:hypothetical protein